MFVHRRDRLLAVLRLGKNLKVGPNLGQARA
jgi:hypothetical protein